MTGDSVREASGSKTVTGGDGGDSSAQPPVSRPLSARLMADTDSGGNRHALCSFAGRQGKSAQGIQSDAESART